jgi:hypothetical protein
MGRQFLELTVCCLLSPVLDSQGTAVPCNPCRDNSSMRCKQGCEARNSRAKMEVVRKWQRRINRRQCR